MTANLVILDSKPENVTCATRLISYITFEYFVPGASSRFIHMRTVARAINNANPTSTTTAVTNVRLRSILVLRFHHVGFLQTTIQNVAINILPTHIMISVKLYFVVTPHH